MQNISIIIPVHNESINLDSLITLTNEGFVKRRFLRQSRYIGVEIILVTDNANHPMIEEVRNLSLQFPLRIIVEKKASKAQLFEKGVKYATNPLIAKINNFTSFNPEALIQAKNQIDNGTDIVIISSVENDTYLNRFQTVDNQLLYKLQKDTQAKMYLTTKYVRETIQSKLRNNKVSDLVFVQKAIQAGFLAKNLYFFPAKEQTRTFVDQLQKSFFDYIQFLFFITKVYSPQYLPPASKTNMLNAGIGHNKKKYITHTKLSPQKSALQSFMATQTLFITLLVESIGIGLFMNPFLVLQVLIGFISLVYFIDIFFTFFLVLRTLKKSHEITFTKEELAALPDENLPIYSVLCPLYKEAHMIPHFLEALNNLDYPKEKLDVILLIEQDDTESIETIQTMEIPTYVRMIIVPDSLPKTKPKACNFGLAYVRGEYVVIYDAEDIPDPMQLKKALLGFKKSDKKVVCLQAKLDYHNANQNLLTRFFTAEYALWFNVTLTGLQSLQTTIPLGGTSNHFRTKDLNKLQAWDPFNVTEDADLGIRLFKLGYRTAIIDSVTLEEANSNVMNWIRQRSRWIKGYMQTYLVHNRNIVEFFVSKGIHAFIFHLVIGGRIAFIFINPMLWIITASYFIFHGTFGPVVEAIYPTPVLYLAISSLIFGNYLYLFCYIIGCVKRGQWGLIKFVYFIPFYWLLMSIAGYYGLYQLLVKPHYWEKTVHGLNTKKQTADAVEKTPLGNPFVKPNINYI